MKRLILSFVLLFSGCVTSESDAIKAVQNLGMTEVSPQGVALASCGENDYLGRKFVATNVVGDRVAGVVCCGTFKGCTVRF